MTSLHGYMDGSYNYQNLETQTKVDSGRVVYDNTVLHALFTTKECEPFLLWVRELDRLCGKLNSPEASFTIFVPATIPNPTDIDLYDRQQLVERHVFTTLLPLPLLQSSRSLTLKGNLANFSVTSSACNDVVRLNTSSTILKQLNVGKSILYLIDQPLCDCACFRR